MISFRQILSLSVLAFLSVQMIGQQMPHTKKPVSSPSTKKIKREEGMTNLQFGMGLTGSVLYLSRNIKEDNDALGYTFSALYGGHKTFRIGAQYTKYVPIDMGPTWYDVKASTTEANAEMIVLFKNNQTILYPLVGFSYNTFQGYFTGVDDFLNLRELYRVNTEVRNTWIGLNVGTGIEHAFGPVVIFADYKMRVGEQDKRVGNRGINIMDVCYTGGLRLKLWVPTLHKLYKGVNDRYHWF